MSHTHIDRIGLASSVVGLTIVGVLLATAAGAFGEISANVRGGVVVAVVLLAVTVPIAALLARSDGDRNTANLILTAFLVKMIGACVRYAVIYGAYDGLSDARRYYLAGVDLSTSFHAGLYPFGDISGTRFLEIVSGFAYLVLPRSELAGFFFFSWIAFLGQVLCTRAIRRGLPTGNHRRYDLLVLFLPSLLFWPSSLGKEAWMVAMIGLVAYGVSLVLTHRPVGALPLALGTWGALVLRPHMALVLLAGLGPAWLVRGSGRNRLGLNPYAKVFGLVALTLALILVIGQAERFFGVERLDAESAVEVADSTENRTNIGGSDFEARPVRSPLDLPAAAVTVTLRPFLWEAGNAQQIATGLESLFLLGLLVASRRQLAQLPRNTLRYPYLMYALIFTLTFIVAFSIIGNFGILVRQRAQLYPLLLVLLIPVPASDRAPVADRRRDTTRASGPTVGRPAGELTGGKGLEGQPVEM